jgi:hypothetical protein
MLLVSFHGGGNLGAYATMRSASTGKGDDWRIF